MNILAFSVSFPPVIGGIETFIYNICRQLAARGHRVRVLTETAEGHKSFDSNQEFQTRRFKRLPFLSSVLAIYHVVSSSFKERPDLLLLGHFGSTHLLGALLVKKVLRIPYVIMAHGTDISAYLDGFTWIDRFFSKLVLRHSDIIIANSSATKKTIERYGYPPDKIYIVNPGVDSKKFIPLEDENIIKQKLGMIDRKVLLSVGRLVKRKGHENVIKALPEIIETVPSVLFVLIGNGPEDMRLKKLTSEMKLDESIRFVGEIEEDEKILYYQSCDLFIMPTFEIKDRAMNDYEGFGIVYLEAGACGKPVVGGRSGGTSDAVVDGHTGVLVDPYDIHEIAGVAIRLLTDEAYAQKLGQNGRKRVKEEMNWNVVGDKVDSIL